MYLIIKTFLGAGIMFIMVHGIEILPFAVIRLYILEA